MNKLYCKKNYSLLFLKKAGANLRHIFLNIRFLNTDDSERIKFADDWIQTSVLSKGTSLPSEQQPLPYV